MQIAIAAAAALLSSTTSHYVAAESPSHGGLRTSTALSKASQVHRELMEGMDDFTPLPCNDILTVDDCDGTVLLSSLIATAVLEAEVAMNATSATSYPPDMAATVPCGVCAIADITNDATLNSPTGIDVQGMLYFPPSSHGTLETNHFFIQGVLKIDPPDNSEPGRLTVKLTGDDTDIFLAPHPHNAMACSSYIDGKCPLGKRPIAVAGGRLDVRGYDYDQGDMANCPSWVNLQDVWEEPIDTTMPLHTSYIVVDGNSDYDIDAVNCWNGDTCSLEQAGVAPAPEPVDSTLEIPSTCLRIITGGNTYDDGYIDVFVDKGDGSGYLEVTTSGVKHSHNSIVVEDCYPSLIGVQVRNTNINAWAGSIETSTDGGSSYTSMVCTDQCSPSPRTTLKVGSDAANCWKSLGDVLLTNSNPLSRSDNQKVLTLASVDVAAGTVSVIASDMGNPYTVTSEPMMAAEVASLHRPVRFTSNHGGHLIIYHTPHVAQKLEGVEVRAFGQSGILGRYPIHFHHSGNVDGSVIRKNVVRDSDQRCIVVHGTSHVLVENNIAYDHRGHCFIASEDGYETDNNFKDNLGARTKKGANLPGTSDDRRCSTFWVTNPNNYFTGNVAAGSADMGFWFEDLPNTDPIYAFRDNTMHSNIGEGLNLYPHGYSPRSTVYFDNLKIYNNKVGINAKRTRNIRIRYGFIADNVVGIYNHKNNGYVRIEQSEFHAVPPHSTRCPSNQEGIAFSYETAGRQIRIKDTLFKGYNNPNCSTVGLALKLVNLGSSAVTSGGTLPPLDGVTFDPPGKNSTFGISPNSVFDRQVIILEDADGSLTGEEPGFFINNPSVGPFSLGVCTSTEGKRPLTMFCAGSCLHTVKIEAREIIGGSTKLIVTSRSDPSKSHQFEGSSSTLDPAYNLKFTLDLMPSDEYDVNFVHAETGELVFLSSTVMLGAAQGYCEGEDQLVESSFISPPVPSDTFHLFERRNATGLVAQSGLVVTEAGVSDFDSGDWVTYTDVWFGSTGDTVRIRFQFSSLFQGPGRIEARLGGVAGVVVGSFSSWNTNGEFVDAAFDIEDAEGLQQLTFTASASSDVILKWFQLAPACFATNFICLDDDDCCSNICSANGFCQPPQASAYFVGYQDRSCSGRNELAATTTPTIEDCAVICDANSACISFEFKASGSKCQLSSSCDYDLTTDSNGWNFYAKVQAGIVAFPEGNSYLWLLDNAAEVSPIELAQASSVQLATASYYIGYHNGGCVGMNELGSMETSLKGCAEACDALSDCVSFEMKRSSTTCQLSSSCDKYSMVVNDPTNDYAWYLNIPDGYTTHTMQGGDAYMWIINEIVQSDSPSESPSMTLSPTSPSTITSPSAYPAATYYMFYKNGGCEGLNELGITTKPVVEECAAACDALSECVSFEYKRSSTTCQLSSSCSNFDLTVNDPTSAYMWYLKVNDEQIRSENPTPIAYLWLLHNLSGRDVTQPTGSTSSLYYVGYDTGGCIGRNELAITNKAIVEECAEACDALSNCVSFEYKRSSTRCHLSSTCDDFSLTTNDPGNSYMWYQKVNSYTNHVATGGNAYLWLLE